MKFSEVMSYYDYKMSNIGRAVDVARETVARWKKKDEIPFNMQCVLEVISKGKLKADKREEKA